MKELLGFIAVGLTIVGHLPYIVDIFKNKTKPHVFSWVIWGIITILAFAGQWQKGGGPGAWTTGVTGLLTILIAILSVRNGSKDITKADKLFFAGALLSIVPWYLTSDATLSIVLLTVIDTLAFLPTIRKTIKNPATETLFTYALNVPRHALAIFALANYNVATYLYPSALVVMNVIVTVTIVWSKFKKDESAME